MIKPLLLLAALIALSCQLAPRRRLARLMHRVTPRPAATHLDQWHTFFEPPFFYRDDTDALERLEDNLQLKRKLGEGAYSRVYQAIDLKTGELVAAKVIRKDRRSPADYFETAQQVNQEIYSQSLLPKHPNLCRFIRAFETRKAVTAVHQVFIITEVCGRETLLQRYGERPVDEQTGLGLARQMLQAIAQLHGVGVFHRDIKLGNYLLSRDGTVKLIDYGFSVTDAADKIDVMASEGYFGREMYLRYGYLPEMTDIWSFGVAVYKLIFGAYPFGLEKKVVAAHEGPETVRKEPVDHQLRLPRRPAAVCRAA